MRGGVFSSPIGFGQHSVTQLGRAALPAPGKFHDSNGDRPSRPFVTIEIERLAHIVEGHRHGFDVGRFEHKFVL
jgi:hypothetical protein